MTTTTAISPMIKNVLSIAKIQPMAVSASQMARITPRTVQSIRPTYPVCARRPRQAAMHADRATHWRPGGRRLQPPFATAAPGTETPGMTRLSGIVTSTAPRLLKVIFAHG
jgi:hypothetical protein